VAGDHYDWQLAGPARFRSAGALASYVGAVPRLRQSGKHVVSSTGIFDGDRYFDVFVEYTKAARDDIPIKMTSWNRGPEAAELDLLPTLWFRNETSHCGSPVLQPQLKQIKRITVRLPLRRSIKNSASTICIATPSLLRFQSPPVLLASWPRFAATHANHSPASVR
jgi:hypothetical protein